MLEQRLVLPHLIAERAEQEPDRTFLDDVNGVSLTYGGLHERSRRWAGALHAAGVGHGDTVAVMMPTCVDAVAVWLGISWLRAIEVPINTAFQGRMLSYIVADSRAQVLVVDQRYLDRFAEIPESLDGQRAIVVGDGPTTPIEGLSFLDRTALLDEPAPSDLPGPEQFDIATIMYTSGTTGPSKGVLVPWAHAHASAVGCVPLEEFDEADVWYSPYPLFHVSGKAPLYAMALVNAKVVLREVFSTKEYWSDIRRYGCTSTLLMGSLAIFLEREEPKPDDADNPLDKVLMAPLPDDVDAFRARFGVRARTVFNMTEISSPIASSWDLHDSRSCGKVREGYECRIVDEHDRPVEPGQLGELIVRASEPWVMMAGYWGMPDKTVDAWRNQWFHTGDGFTQDADGNFYFVDRKKDAIRRRGENISSMEVEAEINTHPSVLESAAIAVPSEWGEDEVKAVVVARPGCSIEPEELVAYLSPRMPRFMVPRFIEVVENLPKTPTAKIRKAVLRDVGVSASTWDREAARAPRAG